jgi:hypothetical protein
VIKDVGILTESLAPLPTDDDDPATIRRRIARVGTNYAMALVTLQNNFGRVWEQLFGLPLYQTDIYIKKVQAILALQPPLSIADLAINGQILQKELGLPASRTIGMILEHLLGQVLDAPNLNTDSCLLTLAKEYLATLRK